MIKVGDLNRFLMVATNQKRKKKTTSLKIYLLLHLLTNLFQIFADCPSTNL